MNLKGLTQPLTDLNQENQDLPVKLKTENFSHCTSIMTWKPPMTFHVFLHYTVTVLKMFRYVFFCLYIYFSGKGLFNNYVDKMREGGGVSKNVCF